MNGMDRGSISSILSQNIVVKWLYDISYCYVSFIKW